MRLSILQHLPETLCPNLCAIVREHVPPETALSSAERIWLAWRDGELLGVCGVRVRHTPGARVVRVAYSSAADAQVAAQIRETISERLSMASESPLLWVYGAEAARARPMSAAAHAAAVDAVAVMAAALAQQGLETGAVVVGGPTAARITG